MCMYGRLSVETILVWAVWSLACFYCFPHCLYNPSPCGLIYTPILVSLLYVCIVPQVIIYGPPASGQNTVVSFDIQYLCIYETAVEGNLER